MPGFPRLKEAYDFVVVGGGHAGLQAGLKAALLHHTAAIIDRGPKYGRSYYSPRMDNIPGFPNGISGHKLLDLQAEAVQANSARVSYFTPAVATEVAQEGPGGYAVSFEWLKQRQVARGKVLILAQGVVDRILEVGGRIETIFPWANQALVDFCIFCDGHELTGKTLAVLGDDAFAAQTALDLLHFEPTSVEVLTHGKPWLASATPEDRDRLERELTAARISRVDLEIVGFEGIREKEFWVKFVDGSVRKYQRGFSALGWYDMHQRFARELNASFDKEGYVVTDEECRVLSAETGNPIPGLYCVGDLRNGWNQIPEAWATAERAVIHAYASYL